MAVATSEAYEFTLEVPEIDDDLLTELLEETCGEHAEAETDCSARCVGLCDDGSEQCCGSPDDVLADLDSEQYCSGSAVLDMSMSDLPFDWPEMDNGVMNGWYVGEGEMSVNEYGEQRDVYGEFHYGESCVEQAYVPLWQ